jgi:lipid A 4'-phosphatase
MPKTEQHLFHLSVLILLLTCSTVVLGIANAFPGLDLSVAAAFCKQVAPEPGDLALSICKGFPAASDPFIKVVRKILFYIPPLLLIALFCRLIAVRLFRIPADMALVRRQVRAVVAYGLGPILIVNLILKAMSGRPRPYESLPFGGELAFVPAGDFSGACYDNCSFVSGEAAAAGWLLCLLPMLGGRYRRGLSTAIIVVSLMTPVLRVVMGGHYLSDAVLGWLLGAAAYPLTVLIIAVAAGINRKPLQSAP